MYTRTWSRKERNRGSAIQEKVSTRKLEPQQQTRAPSLTFVPPVPSRLPGSTILGRDVYAPDLPVRYGKLPALAWKTGAEMNNIFERTRKQFRNHHGYHFSFSFSFWFVVFDTKHHFSDCRCLFSRYPCARCHPPNTPTEPCGSLHKSPAEHRPRHGGTAASCRYALLVFQVLDPAV